jgi:hypothetical protein
LGACSFGEGDAVCDAFGLECRAVGPLAPPGFADVLLSRKAARRSLTQAESIPVIATLASRDVSSSRSRPSPLRAFADMPAMTVLT